MFRESKDRSIFRYKYRNFVRFDSDAGGTKTKQKIDREKYCAGDREYILLKKKSSGRLNGLEIMRQ